MKGAHLFARVPRGRLVLACVAAAAMVAPAAALAADDAPGVLKLSRPTKIQYQLDKSTTIYCGPFGKATFFSCSGDEGVGFVYINRKSAAITSEDEALGVGIDFKTDEARARHFSSKTLVRVLHNGSIRGLVRRAFKVSADGNRFALSLSSGAMAEAFKSGGWKLYPVWVGTRSTKQVVYDKATDTLRVGDGVHGVTITAYSTAAPVVTVDQGGAALYTTP